MDSYRNELPKEQLDLLEMYKVAYNALDNNLRILLKAGNEVASSHLVKIMQPVIRAGMLKIDCSC